MTSLIFFSGGFNIYKIRIYIFLGVLIFTKIRANFGPEVLIFYLKKTRFSRFSLVKKLKIFSRASRGSFFSGGFNIYKISAKKNLGVLLFTKFEQILIWGVMSRGGG